MKRRAFPAGPEKILAIDPRALGSEYDKQDDASTEQKNKIACIRIFGPLEQRYSWFGASYDTILACFREAIACPEVSAILLHIDSPGGDAAGNVECARAMIAAKKEAKKPVVAFADESAYSAAYALACVADEIYLPETAGVGSIGCLCVAADMTEAVKKSGVNAVVVRSGSRKAEGHPLIPLSDETLARFQSRVDSLAQTFAELVSESRGVSARKLLSLQGACFYGDDAVKTRLADGIMSFDDVVKGLSARVAQTAPLDNSGTTGSELTQRTTGMNLTELYAALTTAKAAGDTAKVASLESKIAAAIASASAAGGTAVRAEEDSEDEDANEDAEEDSDEDAAEDDDDDGDEGDDDEPEEEEEETRRSTTTRTYRKSKKSTAAIAAAVEELFPGLSAAQIKGRLMALKDGQGRVQKLERQVKAVKTQQRNDEARKLVAQGIKAGKIPPSQREYWMTQASKKDGLSSLKEYLKTAVPVVATEASVPSLEQPGPGGLSAIELEIATKMNVDPKAFGEQKAKMGTNGATGLSMVRN